MQENLLNNLQDLQRENLSSLDPLINFILSKSQLENQAESGQFNSEQKEIVEKIERLLKELQNSVERIQTHLKDWEDFDDL